MLYLSCKVMQNINRKVDGHCSVESDTENLFLGLLTGLLGTMYIELVGQPVLGEVEML